MADDTQVTVVTQAPDTSTGQGQGKPCLVVFYGKNIGRRHSLEHRELLIGRADASNLEVDQDSVSRHHAKIVTVDGSATVFDMGSTNGTFVNDDRIDSAELRDGDFLRIGQTIFKYLSGSNIETKYHEEIYRLTTIDGLTQAYNKRFFFEALERELNRAQRYSRFLSLAAFDIDHFKKVNDTHGHLAGDYVLRELARLVHGILRRDDIFARNGGEEFAIILPENDMEGAQQVCEKIRMHIETHPFEFAGKKLAITISLGIRTVDIGDDQTDLGQLVADADARLYEAKQGGRNRVCP